MAKEKIKFEDGSGYEGDVVNGQFHGKGKQTFADGSSYEGDFVNGNAEGKGKWIRANNEVYEGDFIKGNPDGKGKYTDEYGTVYEGDFVKGKMTGKGKLTYAATDYTYEGDFLNGKFHGKGIFIYGEGGKIEEGNWENGRYTGSADTVKTSNIKETAVLSQDFIDQMLAEEFGEDTSKTKSAGKIPAQIGALSGAAVNQILDKVLTNKTKGELSQDKINDLLDAVDKKKENL